MEREPRVHAAVRLALAMPPIPCAMAARKGRPLLVVLANRRFRPVVHRQNGRVRVFRLPDTTSIFVCALIWKLLLRPSVRPVPKCNGPWRRALSMVEREDCLLFLKLRPEIPVAPSVRGLSSLSEAEIQRALTYGAFRP